MGCTTGDFHRWLGLINSKWKGWGGRARELYVCRGSQSTGIVVCYQSQAGSHSLTSMCWMSYLVKWQHDLIIVWPVRGPTTSRLSTWVTDRDVCGRLNQLRLGRLVGSRSTNRGPVGRARPADSLSQPVWWCPVHVNFKCWPNPCVPQKLLFICHSKEVCRKLAGQKKN